MRLKLCALSAVLLSGCSWLGMDGHHSSNTHAGLYSYEGAGYSAGYGSTGMVGGGQYAAYQGYGAQGYGTQSYAGAGYATGGMSGYGGPAAVGYQGAYGVNMQGGAVQGGMGAYGNGTVTTMGAAAPYGANVGGLRGTYAGSQYGQGVVASQYANGQVLGGTAVQTVQGAPIYVPQPYGLPASACCAPRGGGAVVGAALPWGLSLFGGTDFDVDGDIRSKGPGPAFAGYDAAGNPVYSSTTEVGDIALSYDDAFDPSKRIGLGLERDLNRSTTLFGQASYSKANGNLVENYTTVTNGTYDAAGNFTPGAGETPRGLDAEFTDLETYTAELGVRKYMGGSTGLRPYVGASAGATYNDEVSFTRTYNDDGTVFAPEQVIIDSGWNPTAAGIVGAEWAVGHRGAIGIESGVRWTDNLDVVDGGGDARITIPLTLRGRVAF